MSESGTTPEWRVAPVLGVRDVRAAVAYYQERLGFHCDPDEGIFAPGEEAAVYAILERDGVSLHLQIRRRDTSAARERVESDAYFFVKDADALHAEFVRRGARILREPQDGPNYGQRDFAVEDPDGNRVLLASPKRVCRRIRRDDALIWKSEG